MYSHFLSTRVEKGNEVEFEEVQWRQNVDKLFRMGKVE